MHAHIKSPLYVFSFTLWRQIFQHLSFGSLSSAQVFDDEAALNRKCEELALLIQSAKHVVVHTGAGISTAAGIPDFR